MGHDGVDQDLDELAGNVLRDGWTAYLCLGRKSAETASCSVEIPRYAFAKEEGEP